MYGRHDGLVLRLCKLLERPADVVRRGRVQAWAMFKGCLA
jgi:hypothetical protein